MPALHVIEGGRGPDTHEDLVAVIDEHLTPALVELRAAALEGDVDAIRAYAYELVFLGGCVLSTGPRRAGRR